MKQATQGSNIIYIIIIALSLFRLIHQSLKFIFESKFIDLAYHYFYSCMVRLELNLFDPNSIEIAKTLNPIRFAGGEAVYSPSYFVFFQPLTFIPFPLLSASWLLFSLLLVFLSIAALLRYSDWDRSWLVLTFICVIVLQYQPLYEDLVLGQNNCLILLFAVGVWLGFKKKSTWMSGISLAAMAFVKIQFGFLLIFILLLGERRVFLIAFFCWIALFFAGLPELGFEHYHQYFFALQNHTSKVAYDLHNISFNGQWHRVLGNDKYQATIMYLTTSLILFISVLVWSYRHKQKASIEIPIFMGLAMIPMLSPNTEPHHLLVTLPALIFVAFHIERLTFKAKFLYMVSAVMIVSRYSWSRFALTSSVWLSPLLSLKIIGVFCLLIVLIYLGAAKVKPSNSP